MVVRISRYGNKILEKNDYHNINYSVLIIEILVAGVLLISAVYLVQTGSPGPAVVGFVGTPLLVGLILYLEIIHRPKKVQIASDHLLLSFRFSKPLRIDFSEIRKATLNTEKIYDGAIKIDGTLLYRMRPEIIRAIIIAYQKSLGKLPAPYP